MPGPVTHTKKDLAIEEHAMRRHGMVGRGNSATSLFTITVMSLDLR
jgi:hypothetical protein